MTWALAAEFAQVVLPGLLLLHLISRAREEALHTAALEARLDLLANAVANVHGEVLDLPRPAPPRPPLRVATPVTLDLTQDHKPTMVMSRATIDAAVREATPTPRSQKPPK